MDTRIGTCSECGGPVCVPSYVANPTARCQDCGALERDNNRYPIVPMDPQTATHYVPKKLRRVRERWHHEPWFQGE